MNNIETAQIITVIRAALPRQAITAKQLEDMVTVWSDILDDIPFELAKIAAKEYCAEATFFPSVGQIRKMALDLVATDSDRITAGDAWDEVTRAIGIGVANHEWSDPCLLYTSPSPRDRS